MIRLPTGVPGLDTVLGGGLEPGSVTVLAGPPGTGKTILAQQTCFANATTDHRALHYTTLSEPHTKLVRHLEPFSFFAPEKLGAQVDYIHLGDLIRGDELGQMKPLVTEVVRQTLADQPVLVVIDSAKALGTSPPRRQDDLRAELRRRGPHPRLTVPVRHLPGHRRPAHQDGGRVRLGPGRRPGQQAVHRPPLPAG